MSLKGLRFTLEVDGQEPDTFAVVNFRLIQNQSYPFVMSVDVASDSFMQTAEMLLEKNATLTIWQGVIPLRYVTGVVAGFGMQENNGWQMRYHLRIEPPLWRCGLRQNFRIFQQQDIRTISAPIFPDTCYHLTHYWLAAVDIPVASDNPVHYADAIRYNARTPLQGSLLPLTRLVWA